MVKPSDKILWLSIIQGWAILLVVIGHVNAFTYSGVEGEMYPMSTWINRFCYSFHMPLFMFVSGGLLYFTRLRKGWGTIDLYKDKLKRLLVPFVAFTVIGFVVKIPVAGMTKSGLDLSVGGFFSAFFNPADGPLKELWFVGTLMWLMFMYPVYKIMLRRPWSEWLLLGMTLLPFLFDMHFNVKGWLNLAGVTQYAFYFVGGILFFKYDLIDFFARHLWATIAITALYLVCFMVGSMPPLVTASLGILMTFGWGSRLTRFPHLFSSFRDHSFQIFLVGIFPQMMVELMVWRHVHAAWMQLPFYVVSCLLALLCGVVMSRAASRLKPAWLRWGFGLK
ncbi:acyltransferase [uncultured Muribaculum sp.]|uniref:acyltransferase family protein n=1 Tax=uncultured Muribaculum sp. TaxID=1918613 RepID=UPI0025CF1921|nr:acyltransferase [uncultured Muribaculum sp.]